MTFEFDGQKYKAVSSHQKEWGQRIIAELSLRGDESILDLGCGDGVLTAELAALVPGGRVLGLDASQGMIAAAKALEGKNLRFVVADINDLDFDGEFDVIFSNAALHWVKDHRSLLANCLRALKPDGVIRFNFAGEGNCVHFFPVVREVMAEPSFAGLFTAFDWPWYMPGVEEYLSLIREFPYRECEVWGENADYCFPSAEALIGWIDQPSIVPFLKVLDGEEKQAFRDRVVELMLKRTEQTDGTYFETFRRINVLARK